VHRLDKDTSGLMVVAKNDAAHISLQAQIQAKTAARIYRQSFGAFQPSSRQRSTRL